MLTVPANSARSCEQEIVMGGQQKDVVLVGDSLSDSARNQRVGAQRQMATVLLEAANRKHRDRSSARGLLDRCRLRERVHDPPGPGLSCYGVSGGQRALAGTPRRDRCSIARPHLLLHRAQQTRRSVTLHGCDAAAGAHSRTTALGALSAIGQHSRRSGTTSRTHTPPLNKHPGQAPVE